MTMTEEQPTGKLRWLIMTRGHLQTNPALQQEWRIRTFQNGMLSETIEWRFLETRFEEAP